jgi:hypothetical protein
LAAGEPGSMCTPGSSFAPHAPLGSSASTARDPTVDARAARTPATIALWAITMRRRSSLPLAGTQRHRDAAVEGSPIAMPRPGPVPAPAA